MQAREFCVYNETRDNFLIPRVTVIDSQAEPLRLIKVLIEGLASDSETGLWLQSLSNVPQVPRLSPFDLVYLDQAGRVVDGVELVPSAEFPNFSGRAASALVLPFRTFSTSKALPGDQVVFQAAKEPAIGIEPLPDADPVPESSPRLDVLFDSIQRAPCELTSPLPPSAEISPASKSLDTTVAQVQPATQPVGTLEPPEKKAVSLHVPFLSSLARININISVSISVTHAEPAARPARIPTVSTTLQPRQNPRIQILLRQATQLSASAASSVAENSAHALVQTSRVLSASGKSLKRRYLRFADDFVYGSSSLVDQTSKRITNSAFFDSLRNDLAVQWFRTWFQP